MPIGAISDSVGRLSCWGEVGRALLGICVKVADGRVGVTVRRLVGIDAIFLEPLAT